MSDYRALFKHSRNYLFATVATKALSFISIPVYTRLLSVEDYGIVNVFSSYVGIVAILLTFSTEAAIGRFYYDAKDIEEFKRFVGTSIRLTSSIILITSIVFVVFSAFLSSIMALPHKLTLCLIPVAIFNITNSIFTQIYNPLLQSKRIAVVSSVQSYLSFILSIVCICLLNSEKYYGYVYGSIIAMILLGGYMISQIKPYLKNCFNKEFVPYILKYCLPYVPDALSGIVLVHFSKIFIANSQSFSLAGSYGFAVNVAALMGIVVQVTNSSWIPYFFRYMNDKDYRSIDNDLNLIWRLTLISAIALSLFGKDLAILLAKKEFLSDIGILPILVTSYVFHQWAYFYLRGIGYSKRMIWNTYCYMFSGILLIVLNYLLTPLFLSLGAAIATLLSYASLFVFAWFINVFIIKHYTPPILASLIPFLFYLFFVVITIWLLNIDLQWWKEFLIKMSFFIVCLSVLIYPYFKRYKSLLIKLKHRN